MSNETGDSHPIDTALMYAAGSNQNVKKVPKFYWSSGADVNACRQPWIYSVVISWMVSHRKRSIEIEYGILKFLDFSPSQNPVLTSGEFALGQTSIAFFCNGRLRNIECIKMFLEKRAGYLLGELSIRKLQHLCMQPYMEKILKLFQLSYQAKNLM